MRISIKYFHLLATVVIAIIAATLYVGHIMLKSMMANGRIARSAESHLKQSCTFITAPTNITLRNYPIHPNTNQHAVPIVSESFDWVVMATPVVQKAIYARNAAIKSLAIFCHGSRWFCI